MKYYVKIKILLFAICGFVFAQEDTVFLKVGDIFQDSINAYKGQTVFVLDSGVHRLQDVVPQAGNVFIGNSKAIMSGARLLNNWQKQDNLWVHYGQNQHGRTYGPCSKDYPACNHPEDLFINDTILAHVLNKNEVTFGKWFFDYENDAVYIADNPKDKKIEISVSERAFGGPATDVTIDGIIIEKYAVPVQEGAITNQYPGDNWIIKSCEIRLNHTTGIQLRGRNIRIEDNFIHHNGQKGIGLSGGGDSSIISGNEISYNNYKDFFEFGWEGGGTKFANSKNLIIRNNYVHHNHGAGLWCDIDNENILYVSNRIENNYAEGIFHEISGSAIIACNTLKDNASVIGANIQVGTSSNVEVYDNNIIVNENYGYALFVVQDDRVNFSNGKRWYCKNVNVHDNNIILKGSGFKVGVSCTWGCDDFWEKENVVFKNNRYHAQNKDAKYWLWKNDKINWSDFTNNNYDTGSTFDSIMDTSYSFSDCPKSFLSSEVIFRKNTDIKHKNIISYLPKSNTLMFLGRGLTSSCNLFIYNMLGVVVSSSVVHPENNKILFGVSDLSKGVYVTKLVLPNKKIISSKFCILNSGTMR